jgi:ORF6N domain
MTAPRRTALVPMERISHAIVVLRGHRVIIDRDLAAIYGATTKRLNEAVKRNLARFPKDFMFRVSVRENAVKYISAM